MLTEFVKNTVVNFVKRVFTFGAIMAISMFPLASLYAQTSNIVVSNYNNPGDNGANYQNVYTVNGAGTKGFYFTPLIDYSLKTVRLGLYTTGIQNNAFLLCKNGSNFTKGEQDVSSLGINYPVGTNLITTNTAGTFMDFVFNTPFEISSGVIVYCLIDHGNVNGRFMNSTNNDGLNTMAITNYTTSASWSFDAFNLVYEFYDYIPAPAGPTFDLLGSTSPSDLINTVAGGVRDTGQASWPLLTLLGVPTSFVIGRYVIGFIKIAV